MTYKIIKKKPMPAAKSSGKYPFAQMSVGDAFAADDEPCDQKTRNKIASCARGWAKYNKPSAQFSTRKIDNVIWVWRTA